MQEPLRITFQGMDPSEAVEQRVREKAKELERFHDRITGCNVTIQASNQRRRSGNLYAVHVVLHVPGKDIVAGRSNPKDHSHEDVYVAIRDTFAAAVRQLEDFAREQRGDVKAHSRPARPA